VDKETAPLRDAGCGIGVSVGGNVGVVVGVNVGVKVGDGRGVSVEVGATVADGSIVICPLHAVSNIANNKSMDKNCNRFFVIHILPMI
jgi:hypothetical protein